MLQPSPRLLPLLVSSLALGLGPARALAQDLTPEGSGEVKPLDPHDAHGSSRWELRVGLEAPIFAHASEGGWANFTQELEPSINVLVGYVVIPRLLALEAELGQGVLLKTRGEESTPKRTGTTLRVGAAISLLHAPVPVYGVLMVPLHLEPSPFLASLRAGVGTSFHLPIPARLFVELDLDFPLGGGDGTPGAFKTQVLSLAAGLLFHL